MVDVLGLHVPSHQLRMKISTTGSTASVLRARKAGLLANLQYFCTPPIQEIAGSASLSAHDSLAILYATPESPFYGILGLTENILQNL
jgi:hypothetical protein